MQITTALAVSLQLQLRHDLHIPTGLEEGKQPDLCLTDSYLSHYPEHFFIFNIDRTEKSKPLLHF